MDETKKNVMTWLLAASICCAVIGTKSSGFDNVSPQSASSPELTSFPSYADLADNYGNDPANICIQPEQLPLTNAALTADEPIRLGRAAASYFIIETPCTSTHR